MRKLLFIAILLLSSCATSNTIVDLQQRSVKKGETTWFNIYKAHGYFFKDGGFILVENNEHERVMLKCHIDTMTIIKKIR